MILDKLNDKQREAAVHKEGPLLILAGAGSGKTSTMTTRIAYLVEEGVRPYNILAVTFTNKAAKEMRDRVASLVGDCSDMWIMTFHSMCLRLLRFHGDKLGYGDNFVVYDSQDQKTLVKNIKKELGISDKELNDRYILTVISNKKEQQITPQMMGESLYSLRDKTLFMIYDKYEKALRENNAMDFDDLLIKAVELLERNKDILEKYQNRFKYIMVDEYQDTNYIQYKLIKLLASSHRNLCVVGDDDQCIYQWRGADIKNILGFEKDFPEAKVIKLEQNYRSKGNILAAAHSVIENNKTRKKKKLWTEADKGSKIKYARLDNEKEEAVYISRQIINLVSQGRDYKDFAILYRNNSQSRQFETAFSQLNIPYRVLSGLRYYDRKEIKDIMAYMRLVVNPKDNLSFKRIINEPKRGMGDKTIEKLEIAADMQGISLFEIMSNPMIQAELSKKSYDLVVPLMELLNRLKDNADTYSVSKIYDELVVNTGYLKSLEDVKGVEAESRIENLMEFKSVIMDYEEGAEKPTIREFMENLTLMAEVDNLDDNQNAVVLMTMHSSKGLEFPVVFLPGLEDGLFPGSKAFDNTEQMEEERRLCYVGMTRAKEELFLTSASQRTLYGRTDYTKESQFLRELDKSLIEGDAIYERRNSRAQVASGFAGPGVATGSIDGYKDKSMYNYKPFDQLDFAKSMVKKSAQGSEVFSVGDRVTHPKFGAGSVIETTERAVKVDFDSGEVKKMALGIAPLRKI